MSAGPSIDRERSAERITGTPELGYVPHETERARTRNVIAEGLGPAVECERLPPDQRVIEFDFGLDAEAVAVGPQFAERLVLGDANADDAGTQLLTLLASMCACGCGGDGVHPFGARPDGHAGHPQPVGLLLQPA